MAFKVADRVKESCTSPGTGTVTLLGAVSQYQSFGSAIGANNTTLYVIADQSGANWEVGVGTIGATGTTLARTTVISSSNAGSLVNFSSGSQYVFCDLAAEKALLLDDSGKLRAGLNGYLDWASVQPAIAAGRMWYDATIGAWQLGMTNGNIAQSVGNDQFFWVKASSAITKGQLCMFTGVVGASSLITAAPATGVTDGTYIVGVAAESIALNGFGSIQCFGVLKGLDTSAFTSGAILWYDPTVAGGMTATKPSAPNIKVQVAAVINAGAGGSGSIQIRVNPGSVLGGTDSNVQFGTLATNNLIQYNGTYWTNVTPGSVTGVGSVANSISAGTGLSGTAFNGSAAQTWTLATAYGDSINPYASKTANYVLAAPNGSAGVPTFRAIVAADIPALSYVSSVTGTSPVASSGGLTPAISLSSGYGDTQNPYASKTANYFLAAPNGSAGAPTFRAIVAADIPTLNQNTTGQAGSVANAHTAGSGLSGSTFNGSAAVTWTLATAYGDTINPYASKTANYFLAAPNGVAGAPTFRAIVAADIPTLNQNTTGTASNVTGTVAVANGGTGLTSTPANGALDIGNGSGFTRTTLTAGPGIVITNGSGSITIKTTAYSVDYLVVAGGGGGGCDNGGGGGAGGYLSGSLTVVPGTAYGVTVGGPGGGSSSSGSLGGTGSNSVFGSITSNGGGGGGSNSNQTGASGGSGGGHGGSGGSGGSGTSGQGFAGGSISSGFGGGGGGGASAAGASGGGNNGGNGGAGLNWQSLGTFYSGGGGGGANNGIAGTGGSGVGGNGSPIGSPNTATAGATNRGGGGGGGGGANASGAGKNGGSGIVIIRYLGSQVGSGGDVTSAGGYTYHTFTTSSTFTA